MGAIAAGIGHNGGPSLAWDIPKSRLRLPKFEPWRFLRPLMMFDGQFYPVQPIQFMDGLLTPPMGISLSVQRTFLGALTSASALTTYSYGSFSPAAAGLLVVGCAARAGANRTVSSLSVGGASQTLLTNPSGDSNPNALVCLPVTAGSYAVSCTFSGACNNSVAFGWLLQNVQSNTPTSTFGSNFNTGSAHTIAGSMNISAGGSVVCVHMHANTDGTTWANANEQYDAVTGVGYSAADNDFATTQTGLSISATWTNNNSWAMSMASWR